MWAIEHIGCEDIHKVFTYIGDLNKSGQIPCVTDGTKFSKTIWNAILDNLKLKLYETIIDIKNIVIPGLLEKKQPVQSIIENV